MTCLSLEFSLAQCLEHLSSVWKVVGQIPIWNSECFLCFFLYSLLKSFKLWLCFSFQISNDECGDESVLGSTSELRQQFIFCFMWITFSSHITDRMDRVGKSFTWFYNMVALAMLAEFCFQL